MKIDNLLLKQFIPMLICVFVIACKQPAKNEEIEIPNDIKNDSVVADLQPIFDSANVKGAIIVFDPQLSVYYSNDFDRCDKGFLPASTFKIPNSIIALETGIIADDSTIIKWDGQKRRLPVWEKDLVFRDAFHVSCVPCYQEIARKVGVERMKKYLLQFDYGNMIVDSSSIDLFWLEGESKITPRQQITFLEKFYNSNLGISKRTEVIMKRMMIIDSTDSYILSGKTGWAIRNENNIGWFTGYIESGDKVYYFATNIEPNESFNMDLFPRLRNDISMRALEKLGIVKVQ